jgi:hypothetical protein
MVMEVLPTQVWWETLLLSFCSCLSDSYLCTPTTTTRRYAVQTVVLPLTCDSSEACPLGIKALRCCARDSTDSDVEVSRSRPGRVTINVLPTSS